MDSAEQAAGERRVKETLIDPLLRRGLARPSVVTVAGFEAMCRDLCERLAYMSDVNLAALEEQVAANPGGKDRDRIPIANTILEWAADIQPPADTVSPLLRAVFAQRLGLDAIAEGWAPELLAALRRNRRWPGQYEVGQIKANARDAIRKLVILDERLAAGSEISSEDAAWRMRRLAAIENCHRVARIAAGGEA